ncbi:DUF4190 domain-containing protein [Actinomadura terrae]|uniref:DUF4190 domain-containing protein n=1 Tax=Actinomadura terrae TaxID=604353 RepID=UPI001FA7636A|nr:DUF4190 domain-containing protein [Actinomadura terrae]
MSTPPSTDDFSERPEPAPDRALPGEPSPPSSGPAGPTPPPPPGPAGPPPLPPAGSASDPWADPWGDERREPFAIVSLVTGLCGLALFGIGFGIVALVRIARRGGKGKGLAIGGIAASLTWGVAVAVVAVMVVSSLVSADRDEAGHIRGSSKVFIATLRVGDCFTGFNRNTSDRLVTALPCSRPHDGEIMAKTRLADGPYPGDGEVIVQATAACVRELRSLAKSRFANDLHIYSIQPDSFGWDRGDRGVTCAVRYTGPGRLTAPIAASVDPKAKTLGEFAVGDCFGKRADGTGSLPGRPCSGPHWTVVYWVQNLPAGAYPGQDAIENRADKLCNRRSARAFTPGREPEQIAWLYPRQVEWTAGVRQIACLGESLRAPLKGSGLRR